MSAGRLQPFHLAIPVGNLAEARSFYGKVMGCEEGRSSAQWVDFNFFGHQLVIHEVSGRSLQSAANPVDGDQVPVPHFGLVLSMGDWQQLADRLQAQGQQFVIAPKIRFKGLAGEQGTLFLRDPSGNALEFKGFADVERQLFQKLE